MIKKKDVLESADVGKIINADFLNDTLRMEAYEGEIRVLKIYQMFLPLQLLITAFFLLLELISRKTFNVYYLLFVLQLLLLLGYFTLMKRFVRKISHIKLLQFFHITLEVTTVSSVFIFYSKGINPETILMGPFIMIYILVIVTTGFRQSQRLSFYAVFLSIAEFLAVYAYLIRGVPPHLLTVIIDLGIGGTIQKVVYILLAGFISALLASHTKRIISSVAESTLEQSKLTNTFGQYVSKEVRDYVLKGQFDGSGELKHGAVLFSDLRNFTGLMENSETKNMVTHLNEYFNEMVQVINANGGVVSKFVGDAILAVFGVFDEKDTSDCPEEKAVRAAVQMQKKLRELNTIWKNGSKNNFSMGIGVDAGVFITGNIGCKDRMEFTCIGNVVNSAMDVEDLTKKYNNEILITDRVFKKIKNTEGDRFIELSAHETVCDGKISVSIYGLDI